MPAQQRAVGQTGDTAPAYLRRSAQRRETSSGMQPCPYGESQIPIMSIGKIEMKREPGVGGRPGVTGHGCRVCRGGFLGRPPGAGVSRVASFRGGPASRGGRRPSTLPMSWSLCGVMCQILTVITAARRLGGPGSAAGGRAADRVEHPVEPLPESAPGQLGRPPGCGADQMLRAVEGHRGHPGLDREDFVG
jgi:hypothetical protein